MRRNRQGLRCRSPRSVCRFGSRPVQRLEEWMQRADFALHPRFAFGPDFAPSVDREIKNRPVIASSTRPFMWLSPMETPRAVCTVRL